MEIINDNSKAEDLRPTQSQIIKLPQGMFP